MDDGNNSEMTMTFTSWSVYKLQILFDSWNVDTKWEFALRLIYIHVFMSSSILLFLYIILSFYLYIVSFKCISNTNTNIKIVG